MYTERDLAVDGGAHQPLGDEAIPTLSWPPETFDPTSGDEDSLMGLGASSTPNTKPTASSKQLFSKKIESVYLDCGNNLCLVGDLLCL